MKYGPVTNMSIGYNYLQVLSYGYRTWIVYCCMILFAQQFLPFCQLFSTSWIPTLLCKEVMKMMTMMIWLLFLGFMTGQAKFYIWQSFGTHGRTEEVGGGRRSEFEVLDGSRQVWQLDVFDLLWEIHVLDCGHSAGRSCSQASLGMEEGQHTFFS